jgi:hypothetical protein
MLDKLNQSVVDNDLLDEREALIAELIVALESMTILARQWDRFSGGTGDTPEVAVAQQLIERARAA